MVDRARRVPPAAWLGGIAAGSFLLRWWVGRGFPGPFIMVDELIYAELGRSLAAGDGLLVRGAEYGTTSVLYPLLIAPAYLLFDSLPDAHGAVKTINAALMSAAAIPAYLLARRVLGTGLSLLAAVLAVALPSLAYTGTVMTENAFYPTFLLVALALVRALERPTPGRQALLLALCAAAVLIRMQGIALVAAALAAPAVLWLVSRAPLRPWAPLYGVVGGGAALLVLAQLARGSSLSSLLGAYAVVGETGYDVVAVAKYLFWHLAELDLYLGVFPLAAFVLLLLGARRLDAPAQAFLAATIALAACVLLVVAAFASQFASNRIQERNLFFLVPLFLIALLVWVDRGAPVGRRPVAIVLTLMAGVLPAAIPFDRFIETGAISDTLMLLPLWNLQDRITLPRVDEAVLLAGVAAALVFLLLPRRWALALPLAVLVYFALAFRPVTLGAHSLREASEGAVFTGIGAERRDWIDRALPDGAEAAILWTGKPDRFTVNQNEFFNRSVGTIYTVNGPVPGSLPETPVTVDEETGAVRSAAGPVRVDHVLTDGSIAPEGVPVARDERLGLTLYRVGGPLISTTSVEGVYDDQWSGPEVTYRRVRCRGGTLTVTLESDPSLFRAPQQVTATVSGRRGARQLSRVAFVRLEPDERGELEVELLPVDGVCTVRFQIAPTKTPPADGRELGIHFRSFSYEAP